jgi:hypothetical protein
LEAVIGVMSSSVFIIKPLPNPMTTLCITESILIEPMLISILNLISISILIGELEGV